MKVMRRKLLMFSLWFHIIREEGPLNKGLNDN